MLLKCQIGSDFWFFKIYPKKKSMNTDMSAPAWNRIEPNRLSFFRITYPQARPRRNVSRTRTVVNGVYVMIPLSHASKSVGR